MSGFRGRANSPEHRASTSQRMKGNVLGKALKGIPKSEDWKAKARASWTPERRQAASKRMSRPRKQPSGLERRRLYAVWTAMWRRCTNKKSRDFQWYGARGIKVYEPWANFDVFLTDMGPRPADHSIERINNDLDYKPTNCKWIPIREQQRNQRHARKAGLK